MNYYLIQQNYQSKYEVKIYETTPRNIEYYSFPINILYYQIVNFNPEFNILGNSFGDQTSKVSGALYSEKRKANILLLGLG